MVEITEHDAPPGTLIAPFAARDGHYTDAFRAVIPKTVTLRDLIAAFYTTPLFKAERLVLKFAAKSPSTDAQAQALADGAQDTFAVWTVEGRSHTEVLLGERSGRTKSWLSVGTLEAGSELWFGSIVVPVERRGRLVQGPVFDTLKRPHKIYSRLLLNAAIAKLS